MKIAKLCIDAGHGMSNTGDGKGFDSGAVANGVREADLTLAYALAVKQEAVVRGLPIFLTRSDNTTPAPLKDRVKRAVAAGCSHLLSIHANTFDNPAARGIETFYGNEGDKPFAQAMHNAMLTALGLPDRGVKPVSKTARGSLALEAFPGPFCLQEIGFESNFADLQVMQARNSRIRYSDEIIDVCVGEDGNEGIG